MKAELAVKDGVIAALEGRVGLFQASATRMRAVLRVPRLAREFHSLMAGGQLEEFACLDDVYDRHYRALGESLLPDGQKERRAPESHRLSPTRNAPPQKLGALSIAERSLVARSVAGSSLLDAEEAQTQPPAVRAKPPQLRLSVNGTMTVRARGDQPPFLGSALATGKDRDHFATVDWSAAKPLP
jgi:hypothetical protein